MTAVTLRKIAAWPMVLLKRQVHRRFLGRTEDPRAAQQEKLRILLDQMAGSDFAKDFGLGKVKSPDDLRQALPIAAFERVAPYVERVEQGDVRALFRRGTRVHMFAMTSGTTAASKHIPITGLTVAEYLQSWTVWGYGVARDYPDAPYGGIINMASNWRASFAPSGVPIGSVTGLLFEIMHKFLRTSHAVPPVVARVSDVDLRYYLILRLGLARQDTTMFNVANPATMINLAGCLAAWQDDLIRDLRDGMLRDSASYPAEVRQALGSLLRPKHPKLAARLAALASRGPIKPSDAWPNLMLMGVWTGGTLGAYMPRLLELYGNIAVRDHGLAASEGRITIPLASHQPYGVLNIDGAFYEFVPEADFGKDGVRTYLAHELDVGQRYYVVMTTSGGLVRYDLHDVVECMGHLGKTPLLKFLHKGKHIANLTGEKLSAYQAGSAMAKALARVRMDIGEYALAPMMGALPGYHMLIEQRRLPTAGIRDTLAAAVDEELCRANIEYADKRVTRRLASVEVSAVADGTFAELRDAKVRVAGTPVEHYKHPFLITDLAFARTHILSPDGVLKGSA